MFQPTFYYLLHESTKKNPDSGALLCCVSRCCIWFIHVIIRTVLQLCFDYLSLVELLSNWIVAAVLIAVIWGKEVISFDL